MWPATLPQSPQKGYTETGGVMVIRTPMDSGPAKQRRRGAATKSMDLSFIMTDAQVVTLQDFVETTILGTARFGFPHPRTKTTVEARIVPQQEGVLYNLTYLAPGYWTVAAKLEILP